MSKRLSAEKSIDETVLADPSEPQPILEPIPGSSKTESKRTRCWSVCARFLRKIWTAMKDTFTEFCAYSSIHGLTHFHNPMWYEKLVFNFFLIAAIVACFLIMQLVRYERIESPIITVYEERLMKTNEIPFPAITVCPQVKVSHAKLDFAGKHNEFLGGGLKNQDWNEKFASIYKSFCDAETQGRSFRGNPIDTLLTKPMAKHLQDIALDWDEVVSKCEIYHMEFQCQWTRIMNDLGVCYTMNLIDSVDLFHRGVNHQYESHGRSIQGWSLGDSIHWGHNKTKDKPFPARTKRFTESSNVVVQLKHNSKDSNNICATKNTFIGFDIFIHNPFEYPWNMDAVQRLSPNMDVRFNIIPKVTITDEHLKSREIHRRRCLFAHESNLKYLKHYTQNNCRLECISKQSRKVCKCTKFWIPSNSSTTNVCGNGTDSQANCWMHGITRVILDEQIELSFSGESVCNCWPLCNDIEYDVDRIVLSHNISQYDHEDDGYEYSRLEFRFKYEMFKPLKREQLYGDLDYIADIGELLSLFIGTSVLSVIELIYFCSFGFLKHIKQNTISVRVNDAQNHNLDDYINDFDTPRSM